MSTVPAATPTEPRDAAGCRDAGACGPGAYRVTMRLGMDPKR